MLSEYFNYNTWDLKEDCVLFFTSATCDKCLAQLEILKYTRDLEFNIHVMDENSSDIGNKFQVIMVPVMIYVKGGIEVDRSYGVKSLDYISKKFLEG